MSDPVAAEPPRRNRFVAVMYASSLLPHAVLIDATLVSSALALLGAGPVLVGAMSLVANLGSVLSYLAAPLLLPAFRTRRRMIAVTTGGMFLGAAGMAGALALPGGGAALAVMIASQALYQFASGARGLPWADLMRQEIPREVRIRLVTQTIVLSLVVATAASWGVKAVLDSGMAFPAGYRAVFLGGAASAALGLFIVAALRRERQRDRAAYALGFFRLAARELAGLRSSPALALTLGSALFFMLASGTAGLYVSGGYLRDPREMARLFGAAIAVRTLVKAVAYFLAGRVAVRAGNKPVLLTVCAASAVAPLVSLLLPFRYYTLVLVATNLMPMFDPFLVNILMNVSTEEQFPARYTIYNVMRFPLSLALPLMGLLVERAMPVFDVLMLLCLAAAALLIARLPREADKN